jgi:hypothetical protein
MPGWRGRPEEFVSSQLLNRIAYDIGLNPVIEPPLAQLGSFAAVQKATSTTAGGALDLGHVILLLLPGSVQRSYTPVTLP